MRCQSMSTHVKFEDWVARKMEDPDFRAADEALEPAYQLARLRIIQGITQTEVARRAGTRQPSIARLERGQSTPDLDFLRRVANALGAKVEVRIVPLRGPV
jgi:DNA-binding XRE family transcriptional regulator